MRGGEGIAKLQSCSDKSELCSCSWKSVSSFLFDQNMANPPVAGRFAWVHVQVEVFGCLDKICCRSGNHCMRLTVKNDFWSLCKNKLFKMRSRFGRCLGIWVVAVLVPKVLREDEGRGIASASVTREFPGWTSLSVDAGGGEEEKRLGVALFSSFCSKHSSNPEYVFQWGVMAANSATLQKP